MTKTFREIITKEQCEPLFKEVNQFCSNSLSEYIKKLKNLKIKSDVFEKDIFDFVWGTVELKPHEILILDSPLLQRLRYIKQLGMADMLYCNATSTRFSHTIGVIEVSSRMAKKVAKGLRFSEASEPEIKLVQIVRLAALFHDAGHMFYSHVSEKYLANDACFPEYNVIHDAIVHVQKEIKRTYNCALHELVSAMIVQSDAVHELLKAPIVKQSIKFNLDEDVDISYFQDCISSLILGCAINPVLLPFSKIIKGNVDADRIDYLSRDSACTKVPISVDASRLIQKIIVVNYRENDPKDRFSENSAWNENSYKWDRYFPEWNDRGFKIMVVKNSATKVCFQLANARLNMYESVYCHHKVLTAETMVREVIAKYFEQCDEVSFSTILSWSDEVFSEHWGKIVNTNNIPTEEVTKINNMIRKIRNRDLYKRVAAFSLRDLEDASVSAAGKRRFSNEVVKEQKDRTRKNEFCEKIKNEYKTICGLVGATIDDTEESKFVFVSVEFTSIEAIPIDDGNGSYEWSDEVYKDSTIDEGKKSREEKFFLLSDCKHRECAYLAFEKVLFENYSIRINKRAAKCLKSNYSTLKENKENLYKKDYYKHALCLVDDDIFFDKKIINPLVASVVNKYNRFEAHDSRSINEKSVKDFLRQFDALDLDYNQVTPLLEGVLMFMSSGWFIGREQIRNAGENCWFKDLSNTTINLCIVGSSTDSSQHYTYYFNDLKTPLKEKNLSFRIESDLVHCLNNTSAGDTIYFFDDGTYSGNQITSIFQEYMGVEDCNRNTKESHVHVLNQNQQDELKKRNIHLLFVLGNSDKEDFIKRELSSLGINNVEISYQEDMKVSALTRYIPDKSQCELVTNSLRDIGVQLVEEKKRGHDSWDEKRKKEAALGYNNAQQMVVTCVSVPTYTVPAFWMDGTVNDREWKSLFTRLEDKIERTKQKESENIQEEKTNSNC